MTEQPQQQPDQVIAKPIDGGNLDQELTQAKRGVGKVTVGLGVAVLALAAFFGGVWTHSAIAGSDNGTAVQTPRNGGQGGRFLGGSPPSGAPGAQGGFRGGTAGTVDRIEGTTIYVKMPDGTEVKVSTTDSTRVETTQEGKLTDLTAGSQVLVQGQRAEDGTVSAQTITKRPAP